MFLLVPVILTGTFLETLSVGMIVPALGILINESFFEQFAALTPILNFFNYPSHETLIFFGLWALATAFLLKNIFLFFQIYCQGTFVYSAKREIALNLYRLYLQKSYLYHLSKNSSEMMRNLTTEVNSYCSFFLMPVVNLITETLVIVSLISLIVWVEPNGSLLLILVLGLLLFFFVRGTHRIVASWGKARLLAEEKKLNRFNKDLEQLNQFYYRGEWSFFLGVSIYLIEFLD